MDPFGGSFSAVSKPNFATKYSSESFMKKRKKEKRKKALDEIYIFSFAPFQISVIFQDFCTIFAKFDASFVDFQKRRQILHFFVKFSPIFFGISHNFSDLNTSDANIATNILQRNVKKLLKFCCTFYENLSEKMYALNPPGGDVPEPGSALLCGAAGGAGLLRRWTSAP